MSIRTTLTLDQDVLERVRRESRLRGASFRDTLNDLLRLALLTVQAQRDRCSFRVKPSSVGLRSCLSYDDVEELLAHGEGDMHG
jgi:hypothetical protein